MNIAIVYFSGTGNTKYIAELLESGFNMKNDVSLFKVEDILLKRTSFDINKYDLIGLGFPTYGFNPPFCIFNFIKDYENMDRKKIFLFYTNAGPLYINDLVCYGLKRKLKRKGFLVVYERQFHMPANILTRYNDDVCKQLCNAAVHKTSEMVVDIEQNKIIVRNDGIAPLFFRWSYTMYNRLGWIMLALDFNATEKCNLCLKCFNECPQNNISIKNGKIKIGINCQACYRCVYNCPQRAIRGRLYNIAIYKNGYDIESIINDDSISGNYITKETKGYYKLFIKYLFDK